MFPSLEVQPFSYSSAEGCLAPYQFGAILEKAAGNMFIAAGFGVNERFRFSVGNAQDCTHWVNKYLVMRNSQTLS